MNIFKRLYCKHEWKTVTNIHGDLRNTYNCMSVQKCVKCGKERKSDELDPNCPIVNFWIDKRDYKERV